MIRQLNESDRKKTQTFLKRNSTYNIFMIGDIEMFGFDKPFQTIYGEFEADTLVSMMLIYHDNVCYYSQKSQLNDEFLPILNTHTYRHISGEARIIQQFKSSHPNFSEQLLYFCENKDQLQATTVPSYITYATDEEDFKKVYQLLKTIDEFDIKNQSEEDYVKKHLKWTKGHTKLYIEKDNQAIATATVTSETSENGMLVGVATHKDYRNKGYASELIQALNTIFIAQKHKSLCLFYDNPQAGSIYHRLGYQTIGQWMMLRKQAS
ncbi:MAG: GNAT family N-acetyltransferase [Candidatus Izemoplasma sp.]|nr:GNAT family N-acetyltransferase [Candidatus Izemoplasma sp.]